ncbi:unnamed protein product [Enterobius vermicularis]|uniref:Methyltransf_21 domain-containing protein n=1 Tax=Enterobius vermicularis TaxID=51028 RepID=A0A0N4VJQ0_ENTVE|nr:unnamed protein product [Enterobius vermicularis]
MAKKTTRLYLICVICFVEYLLIRQAVFPKQCKTALYSRMNKLFRKYKLYISLCERLSVTDEQLPLLALKNDVEHKHVRLPVRHLDVHKLTAFTVLTHFAVKFQAENTEKCVFIALGIGKRVESEEILKKAFPEKCKIYGADPSAVPNKALIESINGTFFEAAIGSKTEIKKAVLLTDEGYKPRNIPHVALEEFLTKIVGKSDVVDWMSIDIEGGEIQLFPSLLNNGLFDKLGMDVCQFNIELHLESRLFGLPSTTDALIFKFLIDALMSGR